MLWFPLPVRVYLNPPCVKIFIVSVCGSAPIMCGCMGGGLLDLLDVKG
jgi:hypothetical protein